MTKNQVQFEFFSRLRFLITPSFLVNFHSHLEFLHVHFGCFFVFFHYLKRKTRGLFLPVPARDVGLGGRRSRRREWHQCGREVLRWGRNWSDAQIHQKSNRTLPTNPLVRCKSYKILRFRGPFTGSCWRFLRTKCLVKPGTGEPTPNVTPPQVNKGWIAGLSKGNQWVFISPWGLALWGVARLTGHKDLVVKQSWEIRPENMQPPTS